MVAVRDLAGAPGDRPGPVGVEHAELGVDVGRGRLEPRQRVDDARRHRLPADREVLDGPRRLRAPQRVGGHLDLAHRVVLGPEALGCDVAHAPIIHGWRQRARFRDASRFPGRLAVSVECAADLVVCRRAGARWKVRAPTRFLDVSPEERPWLTVEFSLRASGPSRPPSPERRSRWPPRRRTASSTSAVRPGRSRRTSRTSLPSRSTRMTRASSSPGPTTRSTRSRARPATRPRVPSPLASACPACTSRSPAVPAGPSRPTPASRLATASAPRRAPHTPVRSAPFRATPPWVSCPTVTRRVAFGPRPGSDGSFSWSNGSRLYYANLTSNVSADKESATFKGFEAIAVSRTDDVRAAAAGHASAWKDPVIISKQSSTTFSDKEQVWADNAAVEPVLRQRLRLLGLVPEQQPRQRPPDAAHRRPVDRRRCHVDDEAGRPGIEQRHQRAG